MDGTAEEHLRIGALEVAGDAGDDFFFYSAVEPDSSGLPDDSVVHLHLA